VKYGLVVFKEGVVTGNDFHGKRCGQIFTQMSGCNIFFNNNLWFKVAEIKMEQ
jgi:hypothetical protein